jgi:hypothetical protein
MDRMRDAAKQPSWVLSPRLTILLILCILSGLSPENPSDLGGLGALAREIS